MTWSCTDPHPRCFTDGCGIHVCLGEDPAAVDDAGDVWCLEHRGVAA